LPSPSAPGRRPTPCRLLATPCPAKAAKAKRREIRQGRQGQGKAAKAKAAKAAAAPRSGAPRIDYDGEQVNFSEWQAVRDFEDEMVAATASTAPTGDLMREDRFIDSAVQLVKPAPPGKPKNWQAYSERFIEPIRINAGVRFWNENAAALARAEAIYGVPAEIIVGIIGVETIYGRDTGRFRVLDVLTTLAFAYPEAPNRPTACVLPRRAGKHPAAGAQGKHRPVLAAGLVCRRGRHAAVHAGKYPEVRRRLRRRRPSSTCATRARMRSAAWPTSSSHTAGTATLPARRYSGRRRAEPGLGAAAGRPGGALPAGRAGRRRRRDPCRLPEDRLYGLVDLQNGADPTEYWVANANFFAITKYNRSYFYAMSVIELGRAMRLARGN
jgi:membrane-bound lytic murein transglycosylase B